MDKIDRGLVEVAYAKYVLSKVKKAKHVSNTSVQTKLNQSSSSTIDVFYQHLGGELSSQIPTQTTQTTSETMTKSIVSEIPQQTTKKAFETTSGAVILETQTTTIK